MTRAQIVPVVALLLILTVSAASAQLCSFKKGQQYSVEQVRRFMPFCHFHLIELVPYCILSWYIYSFTAILSLKLALTDQEIRFSI
jgi:hypothetical protein